MTYPKAAGKLVNRWDPGPLVLRLGELRAGKDQRQLSCNPLLGSSQKSAGAREEVLSPASSSLAPLLSPDLPLQQEESNAGSWLCWVPGRVGALPAGVAPAGSRTNNAQLTPRSAALGLPLLVHTTQTLVRLDNIELRSQRGAFSAQPFGNLDAMSYSFFREHLAERGWACSGKLGFKGFVPSLMLRKTLELRRL